MKGKDAMNTNEGKCGDLIVMQQHSLMKFMKRIAAQIEERGGMIFFSMNLHMAVLHLIMCIIDIFQIEMMASTFGHHAVSTTGLAVPLIYI